jgi:four helix bundle protein
MSSIQSHRDLVVWQKAMDMTVKVYHLADQFPKTETYHLTAQITRAAASVPANVAEGHARATTKEDAHFLAIAKGTFMETETFLFLALRLGYIREHETAPTLMLITEISKMLTALRKHLMSNSNA